MLEQLQEELDAFCLAPSPVSIATADDRRSALVSLASGSGAERRLHRRLTAGELKWLQTVRIKYGATVNVLDISERGIRIETSTELNPRARLVLELIGPDRTILMPVRIIRCESNAINGVSVNRGSCAFDRPLAVPGIAIPEAAGGGDTAGSIVTVDKRQAVEVGFQKVVARFSDGRLLRGFTNDFHASRPHLHLSAGPMRGDTMFVPLAQLKALFFVREFAGNPGYVERKQFAARTYGRRVEVTFADGEVLVGSTLNFRPGRDVQGFFVNPADASSNNLRVFVSMAAVRHIRFL